MAIFTVPALLTGATKIIGGVAKGVNEATKPKKAKQFITGEKDKGGALVVQKKTGIDRAEKIMGASKSSALALIDKPKPKVGFKNINDQINDIIKSTSTIRKVVATRYLQNKQQNDNNRKAQQNLKRKQREAELESKKIKKGGRKIGLGSVPGGNTISRFLSNVLLGAGFLALIQNFDKILKTLEGIDLHKTWLAIRYGLGALVQTVKGLSKFIRKSPLVQKVAKSATRLAKKVKINILKRFKSWNKGIHSFGAKILNKIKKAGQAASGAARTLLKGKGALPKGKVPKSPGSSVSVPKTPKVGSTTGTPKAGSTIKQPSKASRLVNRKHGPAAQRIFDNARSNGKSVAGANAEVQRALKRGQIVSQPDFGLSTQGKGTGRIFKHGVKRSANRVILKLFGPQAANAVASAGASVGKVFKTLGAAAKNIKIPVVGPLIVLITSLLTDDNVNKSVFKGFGTLFGGMLGSPLGPLGMILGEILGEVFGEVLYEGFMGNDGWSGAGKLLKEKWDGLVQGSKEAAMWIFDGTGRLIKNWPKVVAGVGTLRISTPDPRLLVKPKALGKHIWDSFFPKKDEVSKKGEKDEVPKKGEIDTKINDSTTAQTTAIENQASYESGDQVIPVNVDQNQQQQAIVAVTKKLNFSSSPNTADAVNSLHKQLLMAKLA